MDDFFFFDYDDETDTTTPVPVENIENLSEQELEFINDETIRKVWNSSEDEWYFSIIDVVQYLTDSKDPKQYIKKMRKRDPELDSNWGTFCTLLALPSADGKMHRNQVSGTEGILRIIQSIPSKKAEPFKQWLAKVGKQTIDEIADPEKAMERAVENYQKKGYSDAWISQRMRSIEIRKEMTDEWKRSGISGNKEYGILTNILTSSWFSGS